MQGFQEIPKGTSPSLGYLVRISERSSGEILRGIQGGIPERFLERILQEISG